MLRVPDDVAKSQSVVKRKQTSALSIPTSDSVRLSIMGTCNQSNTARLLVIDPWIQRRH